MTPQPVTPDTNSDGLDGLDDQPNDENIAFFNIGFKEGQTATKKLMLDTFMELVNSEYELSITDLELRQHQEGREIPVISKTQLIKSINARLQL